jgi:uncharacterized membrane protein
VDLLHMLAGTMLLRPYVFVFLAAFLAVGLAEMGARRTLVWLGVGYAIAFACEYSSIHNGFPFGRYVYHQAATADRELWVAGVPFMDSLSFAFLSFVSWATAERLLGRPPDPAGRILPDARSLGLAAVLMMAIDLVCDPVSLRGERWFLGDLYHYAEPGSFFGVPVSNFLGWMFVAAAVVAVMTGLERAGALGGAPRLRLPAPMARAPLFWMGIVLFNAAIAFAIDLPGAGWLGIGLVAGVAGTLAFRLVGSANASSGIERLRPPSGRMGQDSRTNA